jgi:hypothetical protein
MSDQLTIEGLPPQPESFAVQLSSNDQRFTATCRDATGRIFVAWHDANLNVVLCEHRDGRLWYVAGPVPGSKNSCVSLLIAEDDYVRVYYGGRMGAESGPFPLQFEALRVPGVKAWPLPGADAGDDASLEGRVARIEERQEAAGRALSGA